MVNRDIAEFVINRINFPTVIEAMKLVKQGVVSCENKVKAGHIGRKTGNGWYEYNEDSTKRIK